MYTFVPNKAFSSLLEISPKNHVFLKTFNSQFQEIKIWFTEQTSKPLEVEDTINVTLIIKQCGLSMKMSYSIEPRERRYVKGYDFLSFARNIGTHAAKVSKNMSNRYSQKLVESAKKSTTDAIKTASKRAIQKTVEATGDIIGNKIADKITSASKKTHKMKLIMKYLKRDIFLQKKDKRLLMN